MKKLRIFIFIISCLGCTELLQGQNNDEAIVEQDSAKVITTYGLRVGVDLSKTAISYLDEDNKGFELTGDFGFKPNLFAAIEVGYHEKTNEEDYLNFSTKGSYVKLGINYNAYDNWIGMKNEIFIGFRYAIGFFSQTLNSYTPNMDGTYFIPEEISAGTEFSDLDAHWVSMIIGLKVETLKNLYLGMSVNVSRLVKSTEPENFKNLFIPGFNRVYSNDMGAGFNYSISYMIPLLKKEK